MKRSALIALLVVIVILLGLFIIGGFIYLQFNQEPYIPDNAYLKIDLSGPLADTAPKHFPAFSSTAISIQDLWYQLARAAVDTRIKGVLLRISYMETGLAKIEEIGHLLKEFSRSKKPVLAFIVAGGLKEYYLASFADKIFMFKGGMLSISGIGAEAVFLKNTLSKLGVQAEIFHIGDYKTASNTFSEDHMTPAHRESMQSLIDDLYRAVIAGIAANRKLDAGEVKKIIDRSPLGQEEYIKAKLIDRLGYEDELHGLSKASYPEVNFKTYAKTSSPKPFSGVKKIAVIFAAGEINMGRSGGQSLLGGEVLGADTLAGQLRQARNNYAVKAVVLRVDSPGGSAVASDIILREAELLAKKKPLVISMSDMAASGGYWISMSAQKILAWPETITGSIGIISGKFVLKGLYDKLGITKEIVKTTEFAGMYSDYKPFSQREKEKVLADMQVIYNEFLRKVAGNRKLAVAEVDQIARGRVWSGQAALDLRLVDGLGGLNEALTEARKLAHIPLAEKVGVRIYPQKKSFWDMLFELADVQAQNPLDVQARLQVYKRFFPALAMPFTINCF
ncbi:MAG: signal peptide peptidase SppA [Candidatus Aminicenantes bacterium]|nr:signal peptide peptidase SppA [Candidatus Aminicenantes bacterium]